MEIVELSAAEVRTAADELAQLLIDAHTSNMALGLLGPLTRERARSVWLETAGRLDPDRRVLLAAWLTTHEDTGSDRFYEAAGWSRLGVLPSYSLRADGTLAGAALYFLEV
jgi:hypothetical protein